MNVSSHNKLVSFIWRIADDCLRDVYVRGKYRDVILPMVVLRRLDTLLEPSKEAVLEEVRYQKEEMGALDLDDEPLREASGYVFYNTSQWTLKKLHSTATNNQQILLANIEDYLGGFSSNVKEIIRRFKLLDQMRHMADKQVLLDVIENFISPYINLTPHNVEGPEGNVLASPHRCSITRIWVITKSPSNVPTAVALPLASSASLHCVLISPCANRWNGSGPSMGTRSTRQGFSKSKPRQSPNGVKTKAWPCTPNNAAN